MRYRNLLTSISVLGIAVTSGYAFARDGVSQNTPSEAKAQGVLGIAVGYAPDYEGSDDAEAKVAPFGSYRWASGRHVDVGGTAGTEKALRMSFNVIPTKISSSWEFGPLLQLRLERDDVDNRQVDNLKDIDDATEAGAFIGYKLGRWSAKLAFAGDVSDEHSGYLTYLSGSYGIPVNDSFSLKIGSHITYADADYMDTYFGVDAGNRGNSTLPDYEASGGIKDAGLSLRGQYRFTKTWGMIGTVSWTRLLNDAEDSPLVDGDSGVGDKNQLGGLLAITYAF